MKFSIKLFSVVLLFVYMTTTSYAAVTTVDCSSDSVFGSNSCNECFDWGTAMQGDNKGLLTDLWANPTSASQVLFKEEQDMPQMIALGGSTWKEIKASDSIDFWQYTTALDALYDEDNLGYVLGANETVTWIESTLGSAYQLENNNAAEGENTGMIVYDIAVHALSDQGDISLDAVTHRECVLIKSAQGTPPPVVPEPPTLPETGAEHLLLAFVALVLGFGFLKFRRKA